MNTMVFIILVVLAIIDAKLWAIVRELRRHTQKLERIVEELRRQT